MCILLFFIGSVYAQSFTESASTYGLHLSGNKDGGFSWGDYDNDGDLDVLINTNTGTYDSRLYRNDGSSFADVTSTLAPSLLSSVKPRQALWGDVNNDGDNLATWRDLDADGDGMGDVSLDADLDGYFDLYDSNASDGPGISGTNGTALMTASSDGGDSDSRPEYSDGGGIGDSGGDDVPDFLDVDSDNDGIYDIYEAQATVGYTPPSGSDDDSDGIDNAYDDDDSNFGGAGAAGIVPVNTDSGSGDTTSDYLDSDSDGDNTTDRQEAWDALGGDGYPDGVSGSCDDDSDGDGLVDCFDSNDSDATVWTSAVTPPNDDGTGGSTVSTGIDISASNDISGIFPNNAGGSTSTEPDWRDAGISPFPVEWLDFAVSQQGNDALLSWSTASELNSDYFAIERATDGISFLEIGREKASGTSTETNKYQFIDPQITQLPSKQFYYRIRQIDVDGTFSYSSVQELQLTDQGTSLWLQGRPSPVSDLLTIDYRLVEASTASLEVISAMGQKVFARSLFKEEGSIEVSVIHWAAGIYYISLSGEEVREMYKVVVEN